MEKEDFIALPPSPNIHPRMRRKPSLLRYIIWVLRQTEATRPLKGRVAFVYPLYAAYHATEKTVDKNKPYVFG